MNKKKAKRKKTRKKEEKKIGEDWLFNQIETMWTKSEQRVSCRATNAQQKDITMNFVFRVCIFNAITTVIM